MNFSQDFIAVWNNWKSWSRRPKDIPDTSPALSDLVMCGRCGRSNNFYAVAQTPLNMPSYMADGIICDCLEAETAAAPPTVPSTPQDETLPPSGDDHVAPNRVPICIACGASAANKMCTECLDFRCRPDNELESTQAVDELLTVCLTCSGLTPFSGASNELRVPPNPNLKPHRCMCDESAPQPRSDNLHHLNEGVAPGGTALNTAAWWFLEHQDPYANAPALNDLKLCNRCSRTTNFHAAARGPVAVSAHMSAAIICDCPQEPIATPTEPDLPVNAAEPIPFNLAEAEAAEAARREVHCAAYRPGDPKVYYSSNAITELRGVAMRAKYGLNCIAHAYSADPSNKDLAITLVNAKARYVQAMMAYDKKWPAPEPTAPAKEPATHRVDVGGPEYDLTPKMRGLRGRLNAAQKYLRSARRNLEENPHNIVSQQLLAVATQRAATAKEALERAYAAGANIPVETAPPELTDDVKKERDISLALLEVAANKFSQIREENAALKKEVERCGETLEEEALKLKEANASILELKKEATHFKAVNERIVKGYAAQHHLGLKRYKEYEKTSATLIEKSQSLFFEVLKSERDHMIKTDKACLKHLTWLMERRLNGDIGEDLYARLVSDEEKKNNTAKDAGQDMARVNERLGNLGLQKPSKKEAKKYTSLHRRGGKLFDHDEDDHDV